MPSDDVHESKTRKGISQDCEIVGCRFAKGTGLTQTAEEFLQIPTHQFEAEHLIACNFRIDDSAYVTRVIGIWIDSDFGTVTRLGLWEKELFRHSGLPSGAQTVG